MNNFIIEIYFKENKNKNSLEKFTYNFNTLKDIKDIYDNYKMKNNIKIISYKVYEIKELEISLD